MKLICLFFIITVFQFTARAQTFAWARSMGGSDVNFFPGDRGTGIVTDGSGNVYTTGAFLGTADFDPGSGIHNLIATNGAVTGPDMFIQKLDANGNFLWAKQLIGDSSSTGFSIALDASSNIYVSGFFRGTKDFDPGAGVFSMTSNGNADIFILKLDANGNFLWAKAIGGPGNEGGRSLVVDNSGNIYVTGLFELSVDFDPGSGVSTLLSNGNRDVFIFKLNSSGNFIWVVSTGGTGGDDGTGISVDNAGNIIATGRFNLTSDFDPGPGTYNITTAYTAIFVWKLNASGNLIWAKIISGNTISTADGTSVVTDQQNNVYYTGLFSGTVDFDPGTGVLNYSTSSYGPRHYIISKLDEAGNLIWAKQIETLNGDYYGKFITLDNSGNVYCTGSFTGAVDFDPGPAVYNLTSTNTGSGDVFIEKLDASGNFVWAVPFGGPSGDVANAIVIDNNSNILTTGAFDGTADFDPGQGLYNLTAAGAGDIFIQKLNQVPCPVPAQSGSISGNNNTNTGQTISYTINTVIGATGYNWSVNGGGTITAGQNTNFVSVSWTAAGNYLLSVNAVNGCGTSANQILNITVSVATAVVNPDNQFGIKIIPNPSSTNFYLIAKGVINKKIKIEVINLLGQNVYTTEQRAITNDFSHKLDFAKFPSSIYNIRVTIDKKVYIRSIVKLN